jgi:hypothetical protein
LIDATDKAGNLHPALSCFQNEGLLKESGMNETIWNNLSDAEKVKAWETLSQEEKDSLDDVLYKSEKKRMSDFKAKHLKHMVFKYMGKDAIIEEGFTALPGGYSFYSLGQGGWWWTAEGQSSPVGSPALEYNDNFTFYWRWTDIWFQCPVYYRLIDRYLIL